METSAKANINVEEAFFTLARFVIIVNQEIFISKLFLIINIILIIGILKRD